MKNKNKAVITAVCAFATVAASVFGTMAYFTSQDEAVNTFTVGNVEIEMDEKNVDQKPESGERDTKNEYKLLPGKTYEKDPTIYIKDGSEDCWLFVKVENGLADQILNIETQDETKTIHGQMIANGWSLVTDDTYDNFYVYKDIKKAGEQQVVFSSFTIDGESVDYADLEAKKDSQILVTAYAIQATGFEDDWQAAWDALKPSVK